jgi:type IV pilus assembly protein PilM
LDIGNSSIKAVKMTRVGGACKIIDFDIVDIAFSEEDKDRSERLQAALGELTRNHKFGSDPVYLAVPGNICLHREFQLPAGSESKLAELVQYEARQQISLPLEQVEWGFERYEDSGGIGVALIAVRKNDIQDMLGTAAHYKLNVRGITAGPMALYNFVHYEFNPQSTTLILDAGAKATDFVVMNKRQIYFRTIQIAGREITRVLENKFKVSHEKAEDLKKNIAQSPQMEKILTVIEPTLRQLGAEVQRTIGFYKSKSRGQRIAQCYLLGHTFRLPKMAEYLQSQVREAPFAIVEGLQRVKLDPTCNVDVWNNEFPTMAVAMGLGLQGLGLGELTLNLLPGETKDEQAVQRWKIWGAASAAVLVATLGVSYVNAGSLRDQYQARLAETEATVKASSGSDQQMAQVVKGIPAEEEKFQRHARPLGLRDRGRVNEIFSRLLALKTDDGKPFFGPENKVCLTNWHVSRAPLGAGAVQLPDTGRDSALKASSNLSGPNSIYAPLAKGADFATLPPELRPDVPLLVVISGEIEHPSPLLRLEALEKVLAKNFPEISGINTRDYTDGKTYADPQLMYHWTEGTFREKTPDPATGRAEKSADPQKKYLTFHASFRWDDKNDPDLQPVEPAPVKGKPK